MTFHTTAFSCVSTKRLIASHLQLAHDALQGARLLLDDGNRNAVYLAQQAVEQIILALAQSENLHFPRSAQHQLDTMIRSLPAENTFKAKLAPLAWLEAYATTFRYPRTHGGLSDPPPSNKLIDTLSLVEETLAAVASYFDVSFDNPPDDAGRTSPPR